MARDLASGRIHVKMQVLQKAPPAEKKAKGGRGKKAVAAAAAAGGGGDDDPIDLCDEPEVSDSRLTL